MISTTRPRFVVPVLVCMILVRASAFAVRTTTNTAVTGVAKRYFANPSSLVITSSKVNGEDDNDALKKEESPRKNPQTGWNHNLPSESSEFWQSSSTAEDEKATTSGSGSRKFRTGWLHNQEAPAEEKEAATEDGKKPTTGLARQRLEQAMKQQEQNHRILATTFHACGEGGGVVVVTEHKISAPLFYGDDENSDDGRKSKANRVDVYFSIVEKATTPESQSFFERLATIKSQQQRASSYVEYAAMKSAEKMVLYLQGGPGFGSPAPIVGLGFSSPDSSWAAKALTVGNYQKIVLMDQRGTGRSTPITKQYLEMVFPDLFLEEAGRVQEAVEKVTNYMSHFRADNIVRDAEFIKDALLQPPALGADIEQEDNNKPRPWGCALGQSFGGFCLMTYLSLIEHPPSTVLFTGGIAPMLTPVYDVYTKLWDVVKERTMRYYDMYPDDVALVKRIVRTLINNPAKLPSGGKLTARRFLQLGLGLGSSPSAFASMHALLSSAFLDATGNNVDESEPAFTRAFLKDIEIRQSFDDHPIYYWLHEAIYADGSSSFNVPTEWAAHRAYLDKVKTSPEFDYNLTCSESDDRPVVFFGEMVFPWMAEDFAELSGVGLSAVANALSQKTDWDPLFDREKMRSALDGKCKAAAAVYLEDMYVEYDAVMKVAARDGPLEKCKLWVTNEYQHSGLRDDGPKIFAKLHGMAKGSVRTPS